MLKLSLIRAVVCLIMLVNGMELRKDTRSLCAAGLVFKQWDDNSLVGGGWVSWMFFRIGQTEDVVWV